MLQGMANQLNKELLTMQGHLNAFTKSKFTNKALMADIAKKVKELTKEKSALDEFVISGKSAKGKNPCMQALEARRAAKLENLRLKKAIWFSNQSQQHSSQLFLKIYITTNLEPCLKPMVSPGAGRRHGRAMRSCTEGELGTPSTYICNKSMAWELAKHAVQKASRSPCCCGKH
jgi:hypothetical protein